MGEFLTVREISQQSGLTEQEVRRRLAEDGLPTFRDPRDRRRQLVPMEMATVFTTPQPWTRRREAVTAT